MMDVRTGGSDESRSFYRLCDDVLAPLAHLDATESRALFGRTIMAKDDSAVALTALQNGYGMTVDMVVSCLAGDAFMGKPLGVSRDMLYKVAQVLEMAPLADVVAKCNKMGGVAALLSKHATGVQGGKFAIDVMCSIRSLALLSWNDAVQAILAMLGKTCPFEAYFALRLIEGNGGLSGKRLSDAMALALSLFHEADYDAVAGAIAIGGVLNVATAMEHEGANGLAGICIHPLYPVAPQLPSKSRTYRHEFPVVVECKYDGVRCMVHKCSDVGWDRPYMQAFTRTGNDCSAHMGEILEHMSVMPTRSFIIDGELYGMVGERSATASEVVSAMNGAPVEGITLCYAAFDILYLDGKDMRQAPFEERRKWLRTVMAQTPAVMPSVAHCAMSFPANSVDEVDRLSAMFVHVGQEGAVVKDLQSTYSVGAVGAGWSKRKRVDEADLAVTGVYEHGEGAITCSVGALNGIGEVVHAGYVTVADSDVASAIMGKIMAHGRMSQMVSRKSREGTVCGIHVVPSIVVSVAFEAVETASDGDEGCRVKLRSPRITMMRGDKRVSECDTMESLEAMVAAGPVLH
jgi:DNA ligase-1